MKVGMAPLTEVAIYAVAIYILIYAVSKLASIHLNDWIAISK